MRINNSVNSFFQEHNKFLESLNFKEEKQFIICQCRTENLIKGSSDPMRFRATFLAYVFLDQFIYTHFVSSHVNFKITLPGPNLSAHSALGHASPNWFLYKKNISNLLLNWQIIQTTFNQYIDFGYEWLLGYLCSQERMNDRRLDKDRFNQLVIDEIILEFDQAQQHKLIESIFI